MTQQQIERSADVPPSPVVAPPVHPAQAAQATADHLSGSPAMSDAQTYNQGVLDSIAEEDPSGANLKGYKHEALKSLQQALMDKGLYHGKVDGVAGNQTKEALLAYKRTAPQHPAGTSEHQHPGAAPQQNPNVIPMN